MKDIEAVIKQITLEFEHNAYPGDQYLQGSFEGSEPYEEVGPFQGHSDWKLLEPGFLDAHAGALSFFSAAGFRFFLPAYLIADLHGRLRTADPLFHLVHGFSDITVDIPLKQRVFQIKSGKSELVNPRRYGALTFLDSARYRLSIFTREEAQAVVAYLEYKLETEEGEFSRDAIEAALKLFWLERAQSAPPAESLREHIKRQEEFVAASLDNLTDS